jgi:hypothetical protein
MGGEATGRRGVEGDAKETMVFPLRDDERRCHDFIIVCSAVMDCGLAKDLPPIGFH